MKINMDVIEKILRKVLHKVNIEKIKLGDETELSKFRKNFSDLYFEIQMKPEAKKNRLMSALEASAIKLVEQLPIVTPIVTAFFETITAKSLGEKIDNLGVKVDNLGVKIGNLGVKIDDLGVKIDNLGKELGSKIDNLGSKIDNLGSKIDNLSSTMSEILTILKERLPVPQK